MLNPQNHLLWFNIQSFATLLGTTIQTNAVKYGSFSPNSTTAVCAQVIILLYMQHVCIISNSTFTTRDLSNNHLSRVTWKKCPQTYHSTTSANICFYCEAATESLYRKSLYGIVECFLLEQIPKHKCCLDFVIQLKQVTQKGRLKIINEPTNQPHIIFLCCLCSINICLKIHIQCLF